MKTFGYIYLTTNILNGKVYVGQRHGEFDPRYFGSGVLLVQSVKKHGIENFKVELLEIYDDQFALNFGEIHYIATIRAMGSTMYNMAIGGYGNFAGDLNPMKGRKVSEETKAKQRLARIANRDRRSASMKKVWENKPHPLKGRKMPESQKEKMRNRIVSAETRAKMSAASKGRKMSEETRAKLSISHKARAHIQSAKMKGKVLTVDHRAKIGAAQIGRKDSADTIARRVAATQLTKARNALLRAAPSLKTAELILAQK